MTFNQPQPSKENFLGHCVAPWHGLAVRPNGFLYPDGQFSKPYGHIGQMDTTSLWNSKTSKELRQNFISQKIDPGCMNCAKKEQSIGHSRRIFFHDKIGSQVDYRESLLNDELDIRYLDLNLSNKCNLKCLMCNSASSSSWIQEEDQLRKLTSKKFHLPKYPQYSEVTSEDILRLLAEPKCFTNLSFIGMHGGEPLLERLNLTVLEEFVRQDVAKNITLEISTNGTALNRDFLKILKHYRQVNFCISLEGTNNLYQYIRGGRSFPFANLLNNIRFFREHKNLNIVYVVTVSIYNIFHLADILDWYSSFHESGEEIILKNVVVRPEYLNFQILPDQLKKIALERLQGFQKFEHEYLLSPKKFGDPGIRKILHSLEKEVYDHERRSVLLDQFVSYTMAIDKIRSNNLLRHVPQLKPLFGSTEFR